MDYNNRTYYPPEMQQVYSQNRYAGEYTQQNTTLYQKKQQEKKQSVGWIIPIVILVSFFSAYYGAVLGNRRVAPVREVVKNEIIYDGTGSEPPTTVISNISPTIVSVITEQVQSYNFWYGTEIIGGAGSGIVISKDGYILTCAHVISSAEKIIVMSSDGDTYKANVIGKNEKEDVAVLKIDAEGLTEPTLRDSDNVVVGEYVYAIGNPSGTLNGTVTDGIISAVNREISLYQQDEYSLDWLFSYIEPITINVLQTNAAVSPGSSGGGLFDKYGNLIGMINAKSAGVAEEGLGFAIPINKALEIADTIMRK